MLYESSKGNFLFTHYLIINPGSFRNALQVSVCIQTCLYLLRMKKIVMAFFLFFICITVLAQPRTDAFLRQLLSSHASDLLKQILRQPDTFRYQLIYTQINRDKHNKPHFTNYYLNVDRNLYFNPASTVKLPAALVALEKMNKLKRKGVDIYTPMLTDSSYERQVNVWTDTSSANGLPSVAQYIRRIFLVSDNDAYNRLYEFDGQQLLNAKLWQKGYTDCRITRRFVVMNEDQNRHTNAIRFVKNGRLIYKQAPAFNQQPFDFSKKIFIGKAHYDWNDSLVASPMDFTTHNNIPLGDLQQMLQSVLFPASVPRKKRFHIAEKDRLLLLKYMSELPSESRHPAYDTSEYFDSYTKFFFFKAGRRKIPSFIRSFNKPGWSYGFLTDVAYIVDFKHNVEFMLSGTIYVNSDAVLNDDKYDYDEIGYPFFRETGEILYQYELNRTRKYAPDLQSFRFDYTTDH